MEKKNATILCARVAREIVELADIVETVRYNTRERIIFAQRNTRAQSRKYIGPAAIDHNFEVCRV